MTDAAKTRITAREYIEMYPETTRPMELINGEVIMSPAPLDIHSDVVSNTMWVLLSHVKPRKLGKVKTEPTDIHFDEHTVVQPDVFFIHRDNTRCKRETDGYLHGPPNLVVEVLSKFSARRDRHEKPAIYARFGVDEYWLIDSEARYIEVYKRAGDSFVLQGTYGEGEHFTSGVLPELTVDIDQIFADI